MNPDPDDNLHAEPGAGRDASLLRELEAELRASLPPRPHPPAEWRRQILPHLVATAGATAAATAPKVASTTTSTVAASGTSLFSRPLAITLAACWVMAAGLKLSMPPDPLRALPLMARPPSAAPAFPQRGADGDADLLTMIRFSNLPNP